MSRVGVRANPPRSSSRSEGLRHPASRPGSNVGARTTRIRIRPRSGSSAGSRLPSRRCRSPGSSPRRGSARLQPFALAIATGHAEQARLDAGVVLGCRYPFHDEPLASAAAELARGLVALGVDLDLAGAIVARVRTEQRPDGGWGDADSPSDVLTKYVVADLLAGVDPTFDPASAAGFLAACQRRSGLWRATALRQRGSPSPWVARSRRRPLLSPPALGHPWPVPPSSTVGPASRATSTTAPSPTLRRPSPASRPRGSRSRSSTSSASGSYITIGMAEGDAAHARRDLVRLRDGLGRTVGRLKDVRDQPIIGFVVDLTSDK